MENDSYIQQGEVVTCLSHSLPRYFFIPDGSADKGSQ